METHINITSPASGSKMSFKEVSSQLKQIKKAPQKLKKSVKTSQKKMRIFLVDDDPLFLKALELSIESIGSFEITTFHTGEACLQSMKIKPAIVILDYYLNSEIPGASNGMIILKHIKKFYPKTKVIMLSAQDSLYIAMDCIDNGVYDYISKSETSLIRINNILRNITENFNVTSTFLKTYEFVLLILILALIALLFSF